MALQSDVPYHAYSGCDMQVYMGGHLCGSLQALTISITRETLPLYVMGDPNIKTIVRGKRGIAGTLVFTNFDRHALLLDHFKSVAGNKFIYGKKLQEILNTSPSQYSGVNLADTLGLDNSTSNPTVVNTAQISQELSETYNLIMNRPLQYSDQIPTFDICLTMVNDEGSASFATVNGVTLINEGYGFTMDDLSSESAYTFIARSVTPLVAMSQLFTTGSGYGTNSMVSG